MRSLAWFGIFFILLIYLASCSSWKKETDAQLSSFIVSGPIVHEEIIDSTFYEYNIHLGGTVDGDNTLTRGYPGWDIAFQPNISLEIENIGTTPVIDPWIVINDNRDWRNIDKIVAEATRGAIDEQDKLFLLYEFVQSNRYHNRALFDDGELDDPVKYFNSYGAGLCDITGSVTCALAYRSGFTKEKHGGDPIARSMHGHVMSEVAVNGQYQFIDTDENAFYLDPENEYAVSGDELSRDHDLAGRDYNKGPLFVSWDAGDRGASLLGRDDEKSRSITFGHEMHVTLRPKEKLNLRWDNIGKTPGVGTLKYFGNSFLVYEPEMDSLLTQNAFDAHAVSPNGGSLVGMSPDAYITIKIASPYVICGGKVDAEFDCKEAADIPAVAVSVDGEHWSTVWSRTGEGHFTCDLPLDELLGVKSKARYDYFIRISLASENHSTRLSNLKIRTDLLTNPNSLPRLGLGENKICYTDENKGEHRVRVTHTFQESKNIKPPKRPVLLYPQNGNTIREKWIEFKWKNVDGAEKYHIRVSRRPDMRTSYRPCFDLVIDTTSLCNQRTGLFNPNETYYWSVRARNKQGVWGKWSSIQTFFWNGPRPPVDLKTTTKNGKIYLTWQPNPKGNKPARYEVYASDMKGFKPSKVPYELVSLGEMSPNFVAETFNTECLIVSFDQNDRAPNKSSYRVIAVDDNGVPSGPSWPLELAHPFIYSQPLLKAKAGEPYSYQVRTLQSLGDLQFRYVQPVVALWEKEGYEFSLLNAPTWLGVDPVTGIISGKPSGADIGKSNITIKVKRTWPYELIKTVMYQGKVKKVTGAFLKNKPEYQAYDEQEFILTVTQ